jgi:hypothetical protein
MLILAAVRVWGWITSDLSKKEYGKPRTSAGLFYPYILA